MEVLESFISLVASNTKMSIVKSPPSLLSREAMRGDRRIGERIVFAVKDNKEKIQILKNMFKLFAFLWFGFGLLFG